MGERINCLSKIQLVGQKVGMLYTSNKAHLLEFYGVRYLRDWKMAQFVSQRQ